MYTASHVSVVAGEASCILPGLLLAVEAAVMTPGSIQLAVLRIHCPIAECKV